MITKAQLKEYDSKLSISQKAQDAFYDKKVITFLEMGACSGLLTLAGLLMSFGLSDTGLVNGSKTNSILWSLGGAILGAAIPFCLEFKGLKTAYNEKVRAQQDAENFSYEHQIYDLAPSEYARTPI